MKHVGLVLMLVLLTAFSSGCSQSNEKVQLLFFSEIPAGAEEEAQAIIEENTGEGTSSQLEFYPYHYEKIVIELAGRNGDLFFVPLKDVKYLIDPVAFTPLTEVAEASSLEEGALEELKGTDPDTDELHVYAVPVDNDSSFIKEMGWTLEEPLAAFIPAYSEEKEEALSLLKSLISS
ncbi:hypothetical protein P6709_11625 [Jeotgalibacillus sp. ET6]|uniref:hypothetical protein n=1 Tax=Jeotgalibacillus sp. ET6 TaxID=3037260 RepID=UPI00241852C9|nr:hypothetical protein [Jeotgalibacillus sp. ET6]MDG5472394.1 hypothetical protein [Jeotgalibacillus sp. ET6]